MVIIQTCSDENCSKHGSRCSMQMSYFKIRMILTTAHPTSVEHFRCVCVCVFQCSSQSIKLISLLLYCSEWLDTWASPRLTSAEKEVFGERDQRPPRCLLLSVPAGENSSSVSSAAQDFKTKWKRKKRNPTESSLVQSTSGEKIERLGWTFPLCTGHLVRSTSPWFSAWDGAVFTSTAWLNPLSGQEDTLEWRNEDVTSPSAPNLCWPNPNSLQSPDTNQWKY